MLTQTGKLAVLADQPSWLDYPTMPVFGPFGFYVANGSFDNGTPSILAWP